MIQSLTEDEQQHSIEFNEYVDPMEIISSIEKIIYGCY